MSGAMDKAVETCTRILARHADRHIKAITPDLTLAGLHLDSLDRVSVVVDLESAFDIEIDDRAMDALFDDPATVADLIACTRAALEAAEAARTPAAEVKR